MSCAPALPLAPFTRRNAVVSPGISIMAAAPTAAASAPATEFRAVKQLEGHARGVARVVFSPDGKKLASASADKTAKIWDTSTGEVLATLEGHERGLSDIAWSSSGMHVVTASDDATARVWEVESVSLSAGCCLVLLRTLWCYVHRVLVW